MRPRIIECVHYWPDVYKMFRYVECDLINQVRKSGSARSKKRTWEIASPVVFHTLWTQRKALSWTPIHIESMKYMYTHISCPTIFGTARVYILCPCPDLFDVDIDADMHVADADAWWETWSRSHFLVSTPVLYDPDSQCMKSFNIFSQQRLLQDLLEPFHEDILVTKLITSKCFVIASGQIYLLGLHRCGLISSSSVTHLLQSWIETHTSSNIADHDRLLWYMDIQEPYNQCNIMAGINFHIGDQPLLYSLYGNTDTEVIRLLLKHTHNKEPLCLLVYVNNVNEIKRLYYISFYSKLFHVMAMARGVWPEVRDLYLDKMSIHNMGNAGIGRRKSIRLRKDVLISNMKMCDTNDDVFSVMEFYRKEIGIEKPAFVQAILHMTGDSDTPYENIWETIQERYFTSSTEWTNAIRSYMTQSVPKWHFLRWLVRPNAKYDLLLFHRSTNTDTTHMYHMLGQFPIHCAPYLFKKHVLEKKLQCVARLIHHIRMDHVSIADALGQYFQSMPHKFI